MASYTPQQAYDAIKNLEAQSQFPIPVPTVTIFVGTFDAKTSTFNYAIPTAQVTYYLPARIGPNGKPIPPTPIKITAGTIQVNAADLKLSFEVVNPQHTFRVQLGQFNQTISTDSVVFNPKDEGAVGLPGGVVVVGLRHILTMDLGGWASPPPVDNGQAPGVTVTMWSGTGTTQIQLEISRPPMFSMGAFKIPALPIALIYAPPPGAQKKNFAEYTNTTAISSKIATSVSSSTGNKTASAFGLSDFTGKITGIEGNIKDVISAFTNGDKWAGAKFMADFASSTTLGINLVSAIFGDTTTSTTTTTTTTTEHDLITTDTDTTTLGTPAGLGPGVGDRFVYLRNVLVAWVIAGGQLLFSVIGNDGIRSFTAQQLQSDLNGILHSTTPNAVGAVTTLDAPTLQSLLSLDPFVGNPNPVLPGPRFVQNDPPSAGGSGTDPNGDTFLVTHDVAQVDITTTTSTTTTVTDYKPGWLNALVTGAQATENTLNTTYSSVYQSGTDVQQTATVRFFAAPADKPYLVGLYYDRLFGTFAFTPWTGSV